MKQTSLCLALHALLASAAIASTSTPVMLDFGSSTRPSVGTSTPAHVAGAWQGAVSDASWFAWNKNGDATDITTAGVVTDVNGNATDVLIDLGWSRGTFVPDWTATISQTPGNETHNGVHRGGIYCDYVFAPGNGWDRSVVTFARLSGFAPGRYRVFVVARETYAHGSTRSFYNVRVAAGDDTTNFIGTYPDGWTAADRIGFVQTDGVLEAPLEKYRNARNLSTWVNGVNYRAQTVEVTATAPDILVAAQTVEDGDWRSAPLNNIQVIPLDLAASFTVSGSDVSLPFAFDASASAGTGLTYAWDFGDGTVQAPSATATASHTYAFPGTYTVALTTSTPGDHAGYAEQTVIVTGNNRPIADAGNDVVAHLGDSLSLDASASTDADGDTLTFEWTQLSGPTAVLTGASTATASYTPAEGGTYVFQVTVSDGTDSDTATVTHHIYGLATTPVQIDFGKKAYNNPSAPSTTPAHSEGVLGESDTTWFSWDTTEASPLADVADGVVDSRGTPVGVGIDIGNRKDSTVPDYSAQPGQAEGNVSETDAAGQGVFHNGVFRDFLVGESNKRTTFVRLTGFAPGRYLVYMVSRNTFNKNSNEYYRIRAGVGTEATQIVESWTADDRLGFLRGDPPAADSPYYKYWGTVDSATWISGVNYRVQLVETTASAPDILVACAYEGGGDGKGGPINALQIVPVNLAVTFTSTADNGGQTLVDTTFTASAANAVSYRWDWGDGSAATTTDSAVATHAYAEPGTYTVRVVARDAAGNIGLSEHAITLAGNHAPDLSVSAPETVLLGPGTTVSLDASATTDEDGDTLSFAWTQLSGPTVSITGAARATASFHPAEAGTYVFQIVVTDSGSPALTATATVTVHAFAKFRAPLNIDFGSGGAPAHGSSDAVNAPAYAAGAMAAELDYWFDPSVYDANNTGKQPDVAGAATAADESEIGLTMAFGTSARSSWTPDWSQKPDRTNISSGMYNRQGGLYGVFCNTLGKDWIHAGSGKKLYVRIGGLEPGRYDVYVAGRSQFAKHLQQAVRIAAGNAETVLDAAWADEEKLAEYYDPNEYPDEAAADDNAKNAATLSAEWTAGVNYLVKTVALTAENPEIYLASDCVIWNDDKGGALNLLQIVPVNDPYTVIMLR